MTRTFLFSCLYLIFTLIAPLVYARSGGVVDGGGGGGFIYHSREEVIQAIEDVWALMVDIKPSNPVGIAIGYAREDDPARGGDPHIYRILVTIISDKGADIRQGPLISTEQITKNTAYIRSQKLKREEDRYCEGKYLASVDRLDREGRICISVFGLMRLPSGSLKADLMGLLIHEAAHLNGFNEEDAHKVQRYFLKHYRMLMRQAGEYTRYSRKLDLYERATSFWTTVIRYDLIDEHYVKSLYRLKYRLLPFMPPPALHDDLGEVRPELKESVEESLEELCREIEDFAKNMEEELQAGQIGVLPRHLREMGKLARRLVDFELLHHRWLFGEHDFSTRFATQRQLAAIDQDLFRIEKATEPRHLKQPLSRPKLICDRQENVGLENPDLEMPLRREARDELDPYPRPCRGQEIENAPPAESEIPNSGTQFMIDWSIVNKPSRP